MKKQNGITLIALVVTIVVLIILAGVSINLILGQKGIVEQAKMGKFSTQFSQIEENIGMYYVDKQAKALQEKTELKIEEMYPVGEKVTVEEKGIMKTEKTELVYKVMELSQRKIEKVNLYWLEQEKIGMKTK